MKRSLLVLLFWTCILASGAWAQARISLDEIPALVLKNDTTAAVSAQMTLFALHSYQGTVARALPQVDLSASYSLGYTPSAETQSLVLTPIPGEVTTTTSDYGNHSLNTKLTLSQLLPTAGSLL